MTSMPIELAMTSEAISERLPAAAVTLWSLPAAADASSSDISSATVGCGVVQPGVEKDVAEEPVVGGRSDDEIGGAAQMPLCVRATEGWG